MGGFFLRDIWVFRFRKKDRLLILLDISQMESVEDGDTVLVAGGQHGTGYRDMESFIERCISKDLVRFKKKGTSLFD